MNWKPALGGGALFLLAFVIVGALWKNVCDGAGGSAVQLPVLAIMGVIALLLVIAFVAGAFTLFNLSNAKEALGLPEGSVRAIIALSLIVLFAILAIYLYSDMSQVDVHQIAGLTQAQKDQIGLAPGAHIVGVIPTGEPGETQRFTVLLRDVNASSEDFAKQLLVMIGTLVTSVASFYFGTKAGTSADNAAKKPPTLRGSTPSTGQVDTDIPLEITGDNLVSISEVKVTNGSHQVIATDLTSNGSTVKCRLKVPAGKPLGPWTIVVTDSAGHQAELTSALTINQ